MVEGPFAAVRLRIDAAKRSKKTENATAMIWRLLTIAESRFLKIDAPHLATDVYRGAKFEEGQRVSESMRRAAA